jgi:predicted protein tyrosine phosphatase
MINSVKVYDISQAKEILSGNKSSNFNAWVSALDPQDYIEMEAFRKRNLSRKIPHLAMYFMDISIDDSMLNKHKKFAPSKDDVKKIYDFLFKLHSEEEYYNIGINCFAGISRSTAIAVMALAVKGETPAEALDSVLRVRRIAYPNLRILKLASEYIGKDFYEHVREWGGNSDGVYVPMNYE